MKKIYRVIVPRLLYHPNLSITTNELDWVVIGELECFIGSWNVLLGAVDSCAAVRTTAVNIAWILEWFLELLRPQSCSNWGNYFNWMACTRMQSIQQSYVQYIARESISYSIDGSYCVGPLPNTIVSIPIIVQRIYSPSVNLILIEIVDIFWYFRNRTVVEIPHVHCVWCCTWTFNSCRDL